MVQSEVDFTAKECRVVMQYLLLKGNSAKEIYDLLVALGDKRTSFQQSRAGLSGLEQNI
jgi:hypothetical protein